MVRTMTLLILLLLILQILAIPSNVISDDAVEWVDEMSFSGTCSVESTRKHIQVNATVVEIVINLTWEVNGTGANLDMWIEHAEGYVVNGSYSQTMPEVMRVREFPNRGRWTLVIVPTSCGTSGEAIYTANISLRNIALPLFEFSQDSIKAGENVSMNLSSCYENVSMYLFEFGDGTDSGWIDKASISKEYLKNGEYTPRARVRYSDGTESEWIEAGTVKVAANKSSSVNTVMIIQVALAFLILFLGLILIMKKRRGV